MKVDIEVGTRSWHTVGARSWYTELAHGWRTELKLRVERLSQVQRELTARGAGVIAMRSRGTLMDSWFALCVVTYSLQYSDVVL